MDADLCPAHDSKPVLETDLRAAVEAEQIRGKVAEASVVERTGEAMRDAKRALEPRQAQRRRQRHEREVGLSEVDVEIGIILRCLRRCGRGQNEKRQGHSDRT